MKQRKERGVILHILFTLLVIAGVSIMYNNPHYGEGISWLANESYEDTVEFSNQFRRNLNDIFNYIQYKEAFETNGKLDEAKEILLITDGLNQQATYTLDDMIRKAKSYGFYLDEKFKVSGGQASAEEKDIRYRVDWRAYDPDRKYKEPGDAMSSEYELAQEVLANLGNYYSFHYRFMQNPSNFKFCVSYKNGDTEILYSNTGYRAANESDISQYKDLGPYVYISGDSLYIDTSITGNSSVLRNISSKMETTNPFGNGNYYLAAAVDTSYPFDDAYRDYSMQYTHNRLIFILGIILLAAGSLGCAATLYLLICLTGHEDTRQDGITLGRIDHIPVELCILFFAFGTVFFLLLGKYIIYKFIHLFLDEELWFFGELVIRVVIFYIACLLTFFSLVRRYKAGMLWSGSLLKQILDNITAYFKNHHFTTRIMVSYGAFLLFNLIVLMGGCYIFFSYYGLEARIIISVLAVLLLAGDFWVFHQMYKSAWENDRINDAVVKISEGNTAYKIDTEGFLGKEQVLADNINHISSGLEAALQEKVRSERLKADLITNVSHDIKTPLTSIINYVDLIKREHIENPKIQGYLEVLEQKSQRLKTLTEDLVEASKASSGNVKLDITDIDFVELIWQANGEFEEKFGIRHLELVSDLPAEALLIRADGRHMWRVLENLYNNTFKYAMEHSRVYIDLAREDGKIVFTIKNVSENSLNINADELTERFVRGDVARTTEGSGLGLSIAKSLTELQGGEFSIYIDGDLFKVQVSFPERV